MKKRNRTVPFGICEIKSLAISLITFLFLLIVTFYGFPNCCNSDSPRKCQSNELLVKNTGLKVEIDEQEIDSVLKAEVKYIEFSDSKQYNKERNIVYRITNMDESEKYSEGSMKKATIRIALEDLNDDGIKEILVYIIQFEYCGKGGGYCTFLILQRNDAGGWRELFKISTYPDIGISNAKNLGFHDLFFRNVVFRIVDVEKVKDKEEILIWRWDGKRYTPCVRRKTVYDPKTKMEKKTVMKWDVKNSFWVE